MALLQAGGTKVSEARATEFGARERFVSAYDSNIGAIRQLFPRDRAQQDLHFHEVATRGAAMWTITKTTTLRSFRYHRRCCHRRTRE